MTDTKIEDINVPKGLKLNMAKRQEVALAFAKAAREAAILAWVESKDDLRKALTDRLVEELWGGKDAKKHQKIAAKLPETFFQKLTHVSFLHETQHSHVTGSNGEETTYTRWGWLTFNTSPNDDGSFPAVPCIYDKVVVGQYVSPKDKAINQIKNQYQCSGKDPLFLDQNLSNDLADYARTETRINEAEQKLFEEVKAQLRKFTSVQKLKTDWPEAFEYYTKIYASEFAPTNTSIAVIPPAQIIGDMMKNFPDSALAA